MSEYSNRCENDPKTDANTDADAEIGTGSKDVSLLLDNLAACERDAPDAGFEQRLLKATQALVPLPSRKGISWDGLTSAGGKAHAVVPVMRPSLWKASAFASLVAVAVAWVGFSLPDSLRPAGVTSDRFSSVADGGGASAGETDDYLFALAGLGESSGSELAMLRTDAETLRASILDRSNAIDGLEWETLDEGSM